MSALRSWLPVIERIHNSFATERAAVKHAHEWVEAWNAHDPERVVADFADDVVVTSPMIETIRPGSGGVLRDKASVLSYYRDGLAA